MFSQDLKSLIHKKLTRKEFLGLGGLAIASLFGISGLIQTISSHAATDALLLETEDGTTSGVSKIISDASAGGGKAVMFGATTTPLATEPRWLSGASGSGVPDGTFASWRGRAVPIFGSWSNDDNNMQNFYQLNASAPDNYALWSGSGDIAVGAFSVTGENWANAASGAYDAMWTTCFKTAKQKWTATSRGTFYMRFAHEWNGNWYPWSVTEKDIANFQSAWLRFRSLQQQFFPACKLVCCINGETSGQTYNWMKALPNASCYDVLGVDYYSNHWLNPSQYDSYGAPRQLASILSATKSLSKPLAFPEWGNNFSNGDHPEYIQAMHDFYVANAGIGSGNVVYEILFNVIWKPTNQFGLFPIAQTLAPNTALRYQQVF